MDIPGRRVRKNKPVKRSRRKKRVPRARPPLHSYLKRPGKRRGTRQRFAHRFGKYALYRPYSWRFRRRHRIMWDRSMWNAAYPCPFSLVSPEDLTTPKTFIGQRGWVPSSMDFVANRRRRPNKQTQEPISLIPGVPRGLELLHLSDHLYIQQACVSDFPEAISRLLGPAVGNRYQLLCGDTKNRLYYGIAKYPCCSGLLKGYRPFKLFLMNSQLETLLFLEKESSWKLSWLCGGYGTKVTVRDQEGRLYGTIRQTLNFIHPTFKIYEGTGKKVVLMVKGPPVIPLPLCCLQYLNKFKLYRGEDVVGTFLEAHYGLGRRNLRNALRIGFPRDLPLEQKGMVVAVLFLLFITYYELGDEYPEDSYSFRQAFLPLHRINPFFAPKLVRPYGFVQGRNCHPCIKAVILFLLVAMILALVLHFIYGLPLKDTLQPHRWNYTDVDLDN